MTGPGRIRIYLFEGSNACLTGRLMLEHKQIDYERVDLPPVVHAFAVRWLGFPGTTVPAVLIGDQRVQGTLEISQALDAAIPHHPLFPSDPPARRRVREAEIWGEKFQNACRRVFYAAARRDQRVFTSFIRRGRLSAPTAFAVRAATPLIIVLGGKAHRCTDTRAREDVGRIPENLDRIDAWLRDGTLGGEALNAADYQIAPNVRAILEFADLAPLAEGRAAAVWARRVVPEYGAAIGLLLPREWIDGLRRPAVAAGRTG